MFWIKVKSFFAKLFASAPALPPSAGDNLPVVGETEPRMILGIIIGHDRKSQGASLAKPWGTSEYVYNSELAEMMKDYIVEAKLPIKPEIIFRDGVGIKGAYDVADKKKCDVVIELHFNGFNGKAHGTSCLTTSVQGDVDFATVIQKMMCEVFERPGMSRGVKSLARGDRGGVNVHSFPGGVNCLVEPFFGDNPAEAKMGIERKAEYAQALVNGVVLWARKKNIL